MKVTKVDKNLEKIGIQAGFAKQNPPEFDLILP
jgi:hypothetical protein